LTKKHQQLFNHHVPDTNVPDTNVPAMETCPTCLGSGLRLDWNGEPDECLTCQGATVVLKGLFDD